MKKRVGVHEGSLERSSRQELESVFWEIYSAAPLLDCWYLLDLDTYPYCRIHCSAFDLGDVPDPRQIRIFEPAMDISSNKTSWSYNNCHNKPPDVLPWHVGVAFGLELLQKELVILHCKLQLNPERYYHLKIHYVRGCSKKIF